MIKYFYLCLMFLTLSFSASFAGNIVLCLPEEEKIIPTNQWGPLFCETQVSLEIKNDVKISTTNESVELIARIKNLSTNTYQIYVSRTLTQSYGFSFSIRSPSGKDLSPEPFNQSAFQLSGAFLPVPPSQINGFEFDLKDICKLDEAGTYKVVLKLKSRYLATHDLGDVVSNPLSVTVCPDK